MGVLRVEDTRELEAWIRRETLHDNGLLGRHWDLYLVSVPFNLEGETCAFLVRLIEEPDITACFRERLYSNIDILTGKWLGSFLDGSDLSWGACDVVHHGGEGAGKRLGSIRRVETLHQLEDDRRPGQVAYGEVFGDHGSMSISAVSTISILA